MRDHRVAAAVTAALAGLAVTLVPASPAAAHARLLGTAPGDGATVTAEVTEVRLRFSEPVRQDLTTVRVTGPDGTARGTGGPVAVDATVTQAVAALPAGLIRVGWRTVSLDGHSLQGSFAFTHRAALADAPTAPAPSGGAAPTAAAPAVSASGPGTASAGWIGGVAAGTAALLAATAGLWWRRRRTAAG
ncbi:copper resistance CopC family protein [Jidongwangia harbinensis]|uniref:copper resistance CopC family protein n=1 Tax=Jidongwangia harbinensis TaxID=2878561 RepID=UPI001CDA25EF|nr:copper resistance CopC family protein [Jidongwangia harbinensis]MCA2211357.1 copper resistance protein CopC [Jidongwangia harbinensis]